MLQYDRVRHISTGRFGASMLVKASGQLSLMKTINVSRLDNRRREELLNEVLELSDLRHPNIVAVQECFLKEGTLCLVLDYFEGGTLAGQVEKARAGGLAAGQVLQWFSEALLGLDFLHTRCIIHRDMQTRRLLLSKDGHVALNAVTLSALLLESFSTEPRPDVEALRYLSPEVVSGAEEHSFASDMWALGVVLYELLALQPPFHNKDPRGLIESIMSGQLRALPARHAPDLHELCYSLLRRDPADRLSTSDVLKQPLVQTRLWELLGEESSISSGGSRTVPFRRLPGGLSGHRPRKGIGLLSVAEAHGAPRGLRCIGEASSQKTSQEHRPPPALFNFRRPETRPVLTALSPCYTPRTGTEEVHFPEPRITVQEDVFISASSLLDRADLAGV
ncbi:unnamed protein product [Polarella glacialis]|uniref:non-specific serine/threonine protein kinase n=1 Tax=Polarella glacialis TaxID=89957 RepID=A0A813JEE6_POLGL|nr:unnamed protein product [Polarella glacialis]